MNEILPSLRLDGDDPRPAGFEATLTSGHIEAAVQGELADSFVPAGDARVELRICLCSAQFVPALPFQLYSFHIVSFNADGEPVDEVKANEEILYAFVINQPVEVQREAALLFLYDLVFRQAALQEEGVDANQADLIAAQAVESAHAEFRDRMRLGWRDAVRALDARARHAGIVLHVRHQLDPFPEREDLVRRMPALRETYNSIELAREFVDKVVSLIGGHDPRVSVPGGPDEIRTFAQRRLLEMGLRHFTAQTVRDAEVLGNGYLVLPSSADQGPYNMRPESVEVLGDDRFGLRRNGVIEEIRAPVIHGRGVEQFKSPYGFSVLEAVLPQWITRRNLEKIAEQAEAFIARRPARDKEIQYVEELRALVARHREASEEQLSRLLWFPRDWVPDAVTGLYFPEQERM